MFRVYLILFLIVMINSILKSSAKETNPVYLLTKNRSNTPASNYLTHKKFNALDFNIYVPDSLNYEKQKFPTTFKPHFAHFNRALTNPFHSTVNPFKKSNIHHNNKHFPNVGQPHQSIVFRQPNIPYFESNVEFPTLKPFYNTLTVSTFSPLLQNFNNKEKLHHLNPPIQSLTRTQIPNIYHYKHQQYHEQPQNKNMNYYRPTTSNLQNNFLISPTLSTIPESTSLKSRPTQFYSQHIPSYNKNLYNHEKLIHGEHKNPTNLKNLQYNTQNYYFNKPYQNYPFNENISHQPYIKKVLVDHVIYHDDHYEPHSNNDETVTEPEDTSYEDDENSYQVTESSQESRKNYKTITTSSTPYYIEVNSQKINQNKSKGIESKVKPNKNSPKYEKFENLKPEKYTRIQEKEKYNDKVLQNINPMKINAADKTIKQENQYFQ